MPLAKHKGGHIVNHTGKPGNKRITADRREVMHSDAATERGMIVNMHMTAQKRGIGHDDVITQFTIVRHMAAGHEEVVAADSGGAIFFFAGAIDRHAFPKNIVVADYDLCIRAAVADILRMSSNDDA